MKRILLFTLFAAFSVSASAQYSFNPVLVDNLRKEYRAGNAQAMAAVERAEKAAEKYLSMKPMSVTEKKRTPPSGDKRDYQTQAPYWWADPAKADGLPYIRRDGERSPEVYDYPERENVGKLSNTTRALSLLYYITGQERYAEKCAELLRVWFLDAKKGMNPNVTFAQFIPGHNLGRGSGIIDARHIGYALNAAVLLEPSAAWTAEDRAELAKWSSAFLYWLEHSTNGRKEMAANNNHGVWYDAIRLMTARAAGEKAYLRELAEKSLAPRFASQVADDGTLPEELKRTLSLHYSTFTFEALSVARNIVLDTGYELWSLPEAQRALEYLVPYYEHPETWTYPQIKPFEQRRGAALLYEAGLATGRTEWVEAARRICYKDGKAEFDGLIFYELE